MNKFTTYIFNNSEYHNIQNSFNEIVFQYKEAYGLWCYEFNYDVNSTDWNHKKIIANDASKIKSLQHNINLYKDLSKKSQKALEYLVYSGYIKLEDKKNVTFYKSVAQNETQICTLESIIQSYPLSWKLFTSQWNNSFVKECVDIALNTPISHWKSKENFLIKTKDKAELVNIIIGTRTYTPTSLSCEDIEIERSILKELERLPNKKYPETFDCTIKDINKLRHIILDYDDLYDNDNWYDKVTISGLYQTRSYLDKKDIPFESLFLRTEKYIQYISEYYRNNSQQDVSFIDKCLLMGQKDSDLYKFVVKCLYNRVKTLKQKFKLGFKNIYGDKDVDNISFDEVIDITNREPDILLFDDSLNKLEKEKQERRKREEREREEREREREERRKREEREEREKEERKRIAEEQARQREIKKKREINSFMQCVSNWSRPNGYYFKYFSLYYYYPTNCDWAASEREWDVRKLIWDFKANPNKPTPLTEVIRLHQNAVDRILPKIVRCLKYFFGEKLMLLTLVCIPSSKQVVTERRYKDFSERLCDETGMTNGYDYIQVQQDGGAKHLGQDNTAILSIDCDFFKDRYVLLFDDVITSGRSMVKLSNKLNDYGAVVIGGLSIGKTRHEREDYNPIDDIIDNDIYG